MRSLALCAVFLLGCGATTTPSTTADPRQPVLDEAAGVRLLALPRPTPGRVWLSLWLDAGARDVSPPQLATVSAWSVAGDGMQARTLADAIELSMMCETDALASCLGRFADALGAREVSAARLAVALARLQGARSRTAPDVTRTSDRLALEALLGNGIDPLGDAADDALVDEEAVATVLADHFGSNRALVIAVGDVQTDSLRAAAHRAFADLPTGNQERARRPDPSTGARVQVGDADRLSLASVFETAPAATSAARRWVARIGDGAEATVFPVRGGTAVLLRRGSFDGALESTARQMVERLREVREEGDAIAESRVAPEDARALARWHGSRWASGAAGTEGGLGLGAVVDGGRAGHVSEDPDADRRSRAQRALTQAIAHAPEFEGTMDEDHSDVQLDNGVRIRATRLVGTENVAVSVIFDGGSREETTRAHGVTALLAQLSAHACQRAAPRELGAATDSLGITVRAHVGPERFGLTVSGPRSRWTQIAYLAARCARVRSIDPGLLEAVRIDLARLPAREPALARAISPDAPGRFAIRPDAIPHAGVDDLLRWRDRVAVGARTRIGVAGDVPLGALVRRLARIAARYPAGEPVRADEWDGPPGELSGQMSDEAGAWIIRSAPAGARFSAVVAAFATRSAAGLRSETALRVIGERHGVFGGRAVVAVFVQGDDELLAQLPSLVPAVSADPIVTPPSPSPSMPTGTSLALTRRPVPEHDPAGASAVWRRLSEAAPSFVMLRPPR